MINEKYCVFLLISCYLAFERWTFGLFFPFFNVLFILSRNRTTSDLFFHARDTQLQKDSFALHCAIVVCFHSGNLHDTDDVTSVCMGFENRCMFLAFGSSGWRPGVRTQWRAGLMRRVWRRMFGTSLRVSLGYPNCLLLKRSRNRYIPGSVRDLYCIYTAYIPVISKM